jgi:hypothetical protein
MMLLSQGRSDPAQRGILTIPQFSGRSSQQSANMTITADFIEEK